MNEKIIKYIQRIENPYILEVGETKINITYSENNKKFEECILNLLKKRRKSN